MARENENANAQGSRDLNLAFMAFKRAEASSAGWPPDKNAIPGTAAGTARKRHLTVASATSSTASCSGQVNPGSTMLGFRIIPSSLTLCVYSWLKTVRSTSSVTSLHRSRVCSAVHEHFRLDDGDQSGFLAQCGIASQRLRVGLDATPAGNAIAHGNHRAPLGKTGAHLRVFSQAIAQSVQTFGYFLSGMTCHVLGTGVDFDAGKDARIEDGFDKGSAIFLLLADRLVVEDRAANAVTQTGRGHNQLPIGAPGLLGLGNPQPGKSLVTGWIALIHRQQALVAGDQRPRGVYELLRIHLGLPHFQLRISGMSSPCWSM